MYLLKEVGSKKKIKILLFVIFFLYFHSGYSQTNYRIIYNFVIASTEFKEYQLRTFQKKNNKILVSKDIVNFDAYAGIFYYQGLFSSYNIDNIEYDNYIVTEKRTIKNGCLKKHSDYTLFFSETRGGTTFVEVYCSLINNEYPDRYFGETLLLMIKIRNDKIIHSTFLRFANN